MTLLELLVAAVVVGSLAAIAAILYYNRNELALDKNKDGKVDSKDLNAAVNAAVTGAVADITSVLDQNRDGKLDSSDVAIAVNKAKKAVNTARVKKALDQNRDGKLDLADVAIVVKKAKKAVNKKTVKPAAKKPAAKKPAAKKPAAKKPAAKKAAKSAFILNTVKTAGTVSSKEKSNPNGLEESYSINDSQIGSQSIAQFKLQNNGDIKETTATLGEIDVGDWITPKSAAGSNYEVRATIISGPTGTAQLQGTFGTWEDLGSDRTWSMIMGTGDGYGDVLFRVEIRQGVTVLANTNVSMSVDSQVS